jgi:hypothetical protein
MATRCFPVKKFCQHVEARLDYGWDWTDQFSRRWKRNKPYGPGVTVRPFANPVTGFQYASSGGQSAEFEPAWPRTEGGTVVDGSITWTAEPISTSSLEDQIVSDVWRASDSPGLLVEVVVPTITAGEQLTAAFLSTGVVGTTYEVENEVLSQEGLEYVATLFLTIED